MKRILLLGFALFFLGGSKPDKTTIIKIAFGSCSHQDKKQVLWDDVLMENPDLWIWLGDNIYGDTENMALLLAKYQKQKSDTGYQKLLKTCPVIGTWDDHDYGENDAGKNYRKRDSSQQEFLDFMGVDKSHPRRKQKGVYSSYSLNKSGISIKVLLLDTRYFRDDLLKVNGKNVGQDSGTILGTEQWNWLEQELKDSEADIHILASSIQVIPTEHPFEKWGNFPKERARLFDLLLKYKVRNPVFISGDRHIGEVSKINWKGTWFCEITSSSLTHGWKTRGEEANSFREGQIVYEENFGLLEISKSGKLMVQGKLISDQNKINAISTF